MGLKSSTAHQPLAHTNGPFSQWAAVIAYLGPPRNFTPFRAAEKSVAAAAMGGDGGEVEKKTAEKICRRCKASYEPSSNTPSSCRFHTSFFVCRRHDDQKRYYELGPDDPPYAAKFYDCCGAENQDASGCTTDFHVSYDE